jgi:hypothetical protein
MGKVQLIMALGHIYMNLCYVVHYGPVTGHGGHCNGQLLYITL